MNHRRLFRYITHPEWVTEFLQGRLYCNGLHTFQTIEDENVRGDQYEGIGLHRPQDGLQINNLTTGKSFVLPGYQFESSLAAKQINILCLSNIKSELLACRFGAQACIEIVEPKAFCDLASAGLPNGYELPNVEGRNRIGHKVRYYDLNSPPANLWALPELLAISKKMEFSWQDEFRLVFGKKGSFEFESAQLQLNQSGLVARSSAQVPDPQILELGDISHICKVYRFDPKERKFLSD